MKLGIYAMKPEWLYAFCSRPLLAISFCICVLNLGGCPWLDDLIDNPGQGVPGESDNAPVPNDEDVTLYENTSATIYLTAEDSDTDLSDLVFSIVSLPAHGQLTDPCASTIDSSCTVIECRHVVYEPDQNFYGGDSFTFRVFDGKDYSDPATVSISVNMEPAEGEPGTRRGLLGSRYDRHDQPFGASVAVDDGNVVVGNTGDDEYGERAGAVSVYRYTYGAWPNEEKLYASDAAEGALFGRSVAIDNNVVVIGATGDDDRGEWAGAVYVFGLVNGEWSEVAKLHASDAEIRDYFGSHVAIRGNLMVVGATGEDEGASGSGAVYVFRYANGSWTEEAKLKATAPVESNSFGSSVAVDDDTIVVGELVSGGYYGTSPRQGAAYVFHYDNGQWEQRAKLTASGTDIIEFGASVGVSGNMIAVGAPRACGLDFSDPTRPHGYVYTYKFDGTNCNLVETLVPNQLYRLFGYRLSMKQDRLAVSCLGEGEVFVFARSGDTWTQKARLESYAPFTISSGISIGIDGDFVVVGSPSTVEFTGWACIYY